MAQQRDCESATSRRSAAQLIERFGYSSSMQAPRW